MKNKKISIVSDFDVKDIKLKDGDTIIIPHKTRYIYHACCDCGLRHRWYIKAKGNRDIILKPFRIEKC